MLKEQLKLLKNAYEIYFSDQRENIDKQILEYVKRLIIENEDIVEKLIDEYKEQFEVNQIYQIIDEALNSEDIYKTKKVFKKRNDGFMNGKYITSIGTIAIECSDTLKVLKYFCDGIKSRNAIAISDIEFDETSLKSAFLVFFCEALEKLGLDKNLLMILPFEECYYEKFDRVIYSEEKDIKVKTRQKQEVLYLYLEDEFFEEEVKQEIEKLKKKEKQYNVLSGDFYKVVNKINKSFNKGAVIYTRKPELGYKFINFIHSENVFVNATFENIIDLEEYQNPLYMNKNIMYQIDKNIKNENDIETIGKINKIEETSKEENSLILPEENIWYKKIIRKIKQIFRII